MFHRQTPVTKGVVMLRGRSKGGRWLVWLLAVWLPVSSTGCSRSFWRKQADRDSYEATRENLSDPRWAVPRIDITPDPRSRFYSPYDPDCEPLPPDDPHAHVYMHWVDGWQGYKCWHKFGDLITVENPQWLEPFGLQAEHIDPETGQYTQPLPEIKELTLCQALELALIHNREYQTQIENVFLRALQVTAERYQFSVRYLGAAGQTPGVDAVANFSPDGGTDSVRVGSNFGVSQFLPTGGQWFVELVNNTIWLFDGPNQTQTASTLAFGLTQPLLFQAGRKVILESLTQAERNLLYAVRDLARFRRIFFTDVVGGQNGFLGLLAQLQIIRNTEANIFRLAEQVEALQAISSQRPSFVREPLDVLPPDVLIPEELQDILQYDGDRNELIWNGTMTEEQADLFASLSPEPSFQRAVQEIRQTLLTKTVTLDVLRLQSTLANSINQLRLRERQLQDSLDDFKIFLGLRTDFVITLDDQLLDQFQFLDARLMALEAEVKEWIPKWGRIDPDEPDPVLLRQVTERLRDLLIKIQDEGLMIVREDFGRLEQIYDVRMREMDSEADRERLEYDVIRDRRLFDDAAYEIDNLLVKVEQVLSELNQPNVSVQRLKSAVTETKSLQEDLVTYVGTLQAVEIGLRVELVTTEDFEMSQEQAVTIALENRLDLKNRRALVMDARRKVEVAANALRSMLDLRVEGAINTPGPIGNTDVFEFRGDLSDLRVGVGFDSPLDLNRERNIYRAALVDYQRARRDYMLLEDTVKAQVREAWRQLQVLRRNLETSRVSTRIAAAQFDSAVADAYAPPRPGQQPSASTAGLSGRNIQDALEAVLNAQNSMIGFWVSYEQNRLNIYRDMDIMEIGPDNVWNDPFYRKQCGGAYDPSSDGAHLSDELAESSLAPGAGQRPVDEPFTGVP
ncbi:MAG: TolC family protein [Planctomycetaceae bacterium]|nr:TolC family protein [Planctomycetaceae bacterium]